MEALWNVLFFPLLNLNGKLTFDNFSGSGGCFRNLRHLPFFLPRCGGIFQAIHAGAQVTCSAAPRMPSARRTYVSDGDELSAATHPRCEEFDLHRELVLSAELEATERAHTRKQVHVRWVVDSDDDVPIGELTHTRPVTLHEKIKIDDSDTRQDKEFANLFREIYFQK